MDFNMENLSLRIYYFDKESFLESYYRWKEGKANRELKLKEIGI